MIIYAKLRQNQDVERSRRTHRKGCSKDHVLKHIYSRQPVKAGFFIGFIPENKLEEKTVTAYISCNITFDSHVYFAYL